MDPTLKLIFAYAGGILTTGLLLAFYGKVLIRIAVPTIKSEMANDIVLKADLTSEMKSTHSRISTAFEGIESAKADCQRRHDSVDGLARKAAQEVFDQQWGLREIFLQERFRSLQEYLDSTNRQIEIIQASQGTILEAVSFIRGRLEKA